MSDWVTRVPFLEAIRDVSAGNQKVPQSDFLRSGELAVVDQGKALIAGYTNDHSFAVNACGPLIVFGDHTRTFKFIDFPFAMGADGVKVLQVLDGFDAGFVYRFLQSCDIPSAGYSRHFKFLKDVRIPKPDVDEQRRIAAILDQADAVRTKRRQVLAHLDALILSIFDSMFGRSAPNGLVFGEIADVQGGLQVSAKRAGLPVSAPYLRVANVHRGRLNLSEIKTLSLTHAELQRTALREGDLLFVEGHANPNEIGRVALWDGSVGRCTHQNHLIRGRVDRSVCDPVFAEAWLNSPAGAEHFRRAGKTTSGLNTISASTVKTAPMLAPPLALQREFSRRAGRVKGQRAVVERALRVDDELFTSLQSRAFRGEL